jgi:DNA-binding MarR family transcriptional regulator
MTTSPHRPTPAPVVTAVLAAFVCVGCGIVGPLTPEKSAAMPATPTLTGQDIAEAQGAVLALLDRVLADTGTPVDEYLAMRVLAVRGPAESAVALRDYLAAQPQLGLGVTEAGELLARLEAKGLITGAVLDDPRPTQLTDGGAALFARLNGIVTPVTSRLYADFDPDDLATARRVLVHVVERADRLRGEL